VEKLGYVLVPAGIAAVSYGIHQVSVAGVAGVGWGAVVGGLVCLFAAYRLMSSKASATSRRE